MVALKDTIVGESQKQADALTSRKPLHKAFAKGDSESGYGEKTEEPVAPRQS